MEFDFLFINVVLSIILIVAGTIAYLALAKNPIEYRVASPERGVPVEEAESTVGWPFYGHRVYRFEDVKDRQVKKNPSRKNRRYTSYGTPCRRRA